MMFSSGQAFRGAGYRSNRGITLVDGEWERAQNGESLPPEGKREEFSLNVRLCRKQLLHKRLRFTGYEARGRSFNSMLTTVSIFLDETVTPTMLDLCHVWCLANPPKTTKQCAKELIYTVSLRQAVPRFPCGKP